jgi:hypothetical protein
MKGVPLLLVPLVVVLACSDHPTGPGLGPEMQVGHEPGVVAADPAGSGSVISSVTGSGHLFSPVAGAWRTFTINATKDGTGAVHGHFQWRAHLGGGGSKVSGSVICFSVDGNQAWLAVLFEKAAGEQNIGKWASIWVVDHGQGAGAPPDELGIRWRGLPDGDFDPHEFCSERWTDLELLPVESGNFQVN